MATVGLTRPSTHSPAGSVGHRSVRSIADIGQSATWSGDPLADIWTLTVAGATNDTEYTLTFTLPGGVERTASYTSDSSASIDEIGAGLLAAIVADPILNAFMTAVYNTSPNTLVMTGFTGAANAFTVAESSSDLTLAHTQTAADGSTIAPARLVVKSTATSALTKPAPTARPVTTLTARAVGVTLAYAANTFYLVTITVGGATYSALAAAETDVATTRGNLVAEINAVMPANTVVAADGSAGAFTLTAEVVGQSFTVTFGVGGGTGTLTQTSDTALLTDDIAKVALGFTEMFGTLQSRTFASGNDVEWQPGDAILCNLVGRQWIDVDGSAPSQGGAVYVSVTTGKASTASGSSKCLLPGVLFTGRALADGSGYEIAATLPTPA